MDAKSAKPAPTWFKQAGVNADSAFGRAYIYGNILHLPQFESWLSGDFALTSYPNAIEEIRFAMLSTMDIVESIENIDEELKNITAFLQHVKLRGDILSPDALQRPVFTHTFHFEEPQSSATPTLLGHAIERGNYLFARVLLDVCPINDYFMPMIAHAPDLAFKACAIPFNQVYHAPSQKIVLQKLLSALSPQALTSPIGLRILHRAISGYQDVQTVQYFLGLNDGAGRGGVWMLTSDGTKLKSPFAVIPRSHDWVTRWQCTQFDKIRELLSATMNDFLAYRHAFIAMIFAMPYFPDAGRIIADYAMPAIHGADDKTFCTGPPSLFSTLEKISEDKQQQMLRAIDHLSPQVLATYFVDMNIPAPHDVKFSILLEVLKRWGQLCLRRATHLLAINIHSTSPAAAAVRPVSILLGLPKLIQKIDAELNVLNGPVTRETIKNTNIPLFQALLDLIQESGWTTGKELFKSFSYSGDSGASKLLKGNGTSLRGNAPERTTHRSPSRSLNVHLVSDDGTRWTIVKTGITRKTRTGRALFDMARHMVACAKRNPINAKPPTCMLHFPKGTFEQTAQELASLGVIVTGPIHPNPDEGGGGGDGHPAAAAGAGADAALAANK